MQEGIKLFSKHPSLRIFSKHNLLDIFGNFIREQLKDEEKMVLFRHE